MDILYAHAASLSKVFAQTGDKHIQTSPQKVIVGSPYRLEDMGSLNNSVFVVQ